LFWPISLSSINTWAWNIYLHLIHSIHLQWIRNETNKQCKAIFAMNFYWCDEKQCLQWISNQCIANTALHRVILHYIAVHLIILHRIGIIALHVLLTFDYRLFLNALYLANENFHSLFISWLSHQLGNLRWL